MARKLIFFLDFDGTISEADVSHTMSVKFAGPAAEAINRQWEQKEITTAQCAQRILDLITVSPDELWQFFATVAIDSAFPEFLAWARAYGTPVYILSDGYDLYIDYLLKRNNLSLPFYANKLRYHKRWIIEPLNNNRECGQCGVCKKKIIENLTETGEQMVKIYVGDGYSDTCPAPICDLIFAKDKLADFCRKKRILHYPFQNFREIMAMIQELIKCGQI